jgi:hypothetical protein
VHALVVPAPLSEKEPAGQGKHELDPAVEYVPAAHAEHAAELLPPAAVGEKRPAGQRPEHDEVRRPTTDELYQVPGGHVVHARVAEPVSGVSWYVPTGHAEQSVLVVAVQPVICWPAAQPDEHALVHACVV